MHESITAHKISVSLNAPTFNEDEIQSAIQVLRSGQVTMSHRCFEFENKFSKHLQINNAVFVNSGSSANLLAFFALTNPLCPVIEGRQSVHPGDEVIVPAVTWSTTIWPVVQAGLIPVIVDCDPHTLQMKPESVRKALSPRTKIICPVHVLGNAVDMDFIRDFASENKLWIVEDTCEALGTRYRDQFVGTLGDIGTYSFFFSHHITTIEGGMVVTPHDELAELLRAMRAHGWTRHLKDREAVEKKYPDIDPRFLFISTGFNLRPTEINAAFGLLQIDKLEKFNHNRVVVTEKWISAFRDEIEKGYFTPMRITPHVNATWFGFPILCRDHALRNVFQRYLEDHHIETRPIICGNLARQPAFKLIQHRIADELVGADQVMDRGLFWGSHPIMTEEQIQYVIQIVKGFFK
jgi:CDP-6-deoxy-D-xylo-4-hexulose-3-dehydrase